MPQLPCKVLRISPNARTQPSRIAELERVTGCPVIVGVMNSRDVTAILDEARHQQVDVIALDSATASAADIAHGAAAAGIAVVVVPHIEEHSERHGRGVITTFNGYQRVNELGERASLGDGELRVEIVRSRSDRERDSK